MITETGNMLYISERIINISDLEEQIQNAKLHFAVLKRSLKNTALSPEIESAVYQVERSLENASTFEFCLEKRKCEIKDFSVHPK